MLGSLFKIAVDKMRTTFVSGNDHANQSHDGKHDQNNKRDMVPLSLASLGDIVSHVNIAIEPTSFATETCHRWIAVSSLIKEYGAAQPHDPAIECMIRSINNIATGIRLSDNGHSAELDKQDILRIHQGGPVLYAARNWYHDTKPDFSNVVSFNIKSASPVQPYNPYAAKGDVISAFLGKYNHMMDTQIMPATAFEQETVKLASKAGFPGRKYNR